MQPADVRPEPSLQRKAALVHAGAVDHAGSVEVRPIPDFDLDKTIFQTLEGRAARFVMRTRIAREVTWKPAPTQTVQSAYEKEARPIPPVSSELLRFMVQECDFAVEHAEGSFLDHLYFCFEYSARHFPGHSPLVMLLHSILGTGTNTFAMSADKIPHLIPLLTPFEWAQSEAFPSILRLLYASRLRAELRENAHRADGLRSISLHRVIDNEPITLSGEDLWIALNYQLVHLVDFIPVANWPVHQNDTSFILFRDLHDLLRVSGKLEATVNYVPATGPRVLRGETQGIGGWLTTRIPVATSERMASASVKRFSARIGHSLDYSLTWG